MWEDEGGGGEEHLLKGKVEGGGGEEDRGEDRAAEKLSLSEKSSGLSREMETACRRWCDAAARQTRRWQRGRAWQGIKRERERNGGRRRRKNLEKKWVKNPPKPPYLTTQPEVGNRLIDSLPWVWIKKSDEPAAAFRRVGGFNTLHRWAHKRHISGSLLLRDFFCLLLGCHMGEERKKADVWAFTECDRGSDWKAK